MRTAGTSTDPIRKNLTIMAGLAVVGLMAFGLALSFYQNLLFEQTLQELGSRNGALLQEIEQGYRDLDYFRSPQFKDKFAKEKLGRINPREKVLLLPHIRETLMEEHSTIAPEERQRALYEEFLRQTPIINHWMLYLFHRAKLENLQKGTAQKAYEECRCPIAARARIPPLFPSPPHIPG